MASFTKSTLQSVISIGSLLRHRREAFALELEDIEAALTISKKNIASLEADRFEDIPEDLYRELFLKNYSSYLGFDWSEVRAEYRTQTQLYHSTLEVRSGTPLPKKEIQRSSLWVPARILKNGGLIGVVSLCALYLAFLGYGIVRPPSLKVMAPSDTMSVHDGHVMVVGKTQNDASVIINGMPVTKERDGSFQQDVILAEGMNIVRISALKKYSAASVVTRQIFFSRGDVSVTTPAQHNF